MNGIADREQRLADFATLLVYIWHRDFPVDSSWRVGAGRSDWTLHVASSVRAVGAMMGYFTHCEDSARTDGVLRNNNGTQIAAVEWEWNELTAAPSYNEIAKLRRRVDEDGGFAVLVCYVQELRRDAEFASVASAWRGAQGPLLLVAITFEGSARSFREIIMLRIDGGRGNLTTLRTVAALPWKLVGTRWEEKQRPEAP